MGERPLTKRQLGLLLIVAGLAGLVAVLAIDLPAAGRQGGLGPAQLLASGGMLLVALTGVTLLPLGDRLA